MNNQNSNSVVPNDSTTTDSLKDITKKIASELEDALEPLKTSLYVESWNDNGTIDLVMENTDIRYFISVIQCSCGEIKLVYQMIDRSPCYHLTNDSMGSCNSVSEFIKDNWIE